MQIRYIPLILTSVFMAAHFLRSGNFVLVVICLAVPFLAAVKKRWILRSLKVFTILSALVWLLTLSDIIDQRTLAGRPWMASAIILGAVALLALFSGWLLNTKPVKDQFPKQPVADAQKRA